MKRSALRLAVAGLVLVAAGCEPPPPAPTPAPPASVPVVAPSPPGEPAPPPAPADPDDLGPIREVPTPLPTRPSEPPGPMNPPFGGEGVLLDRYEFGGIGGFGDRVRVVGEQATLFHWEDEVVSAPLTSAESQALAALLAAKAPINGQSDDGDVPDGMSTGFFFAGRGTSKDDGGLDRFVAQLTERLRAAAPPR